MAEITDEYMLERLAKTRNYALLLLKQGPNWSARTRHQLAHPN